MSWGQLLGSIGGTWADTEGQKRTNRSNMKWNKHVFQANLNWQNEMAHNAILYRVKDAERAGLHPLAALGMSPGSASPIAVGSTQHFSSNMGQDLARAGHAMDSIINRKAAKLELAIKREQLNQLKLQTLGMRKDIQDRNTNPPIPVPYPQNPSTQSISGVTVKPDEQTFSSQAGVTAGFHPEESWVVDKKGIVKRGLSKDRAESMESDFLANTGYQLGKFVDLADNYGVMLDNNPIGYIKFAKKMRKHRPPAPKGHEYRWSFKSNGWALHKKSHPGDTRFYANSKYKASHKERPKTHKGKFNWRYR